MTTTFQPTPDLRAAATEAADTLQEALAVHVYGDDDIPDTCGILDTLNKLRAALGLGPAPVGARAVYLYSATFAGRDGEPDRYEVEVCADDLDDALVIGRRDLINVRPYATKIDARVSRVPAPTPYIIAPPRLDADAPASRPAAVTLAAAILEPLGFVAESIDRGGVVMVKRITHPTTKAVAGVILATDAADTGKAPALTAKAGGWRMTRYVGDGLATLPVESVSFAAGTSGDFLAATAERMAADARRDAFGAI